jgi:thioredoxin 1
MKSILLIVLTGTLMSGVAQNAKITDKRANVQDTTEQAKAQKIKVTFIELGSVRCIPCKMMQPVMKSVEKKYAGKVKVVFHDVWTPEGKPFGEKYGIAAIPTQVFLDENGKEFFRHEGYFPEEELVKVLKTKGKI